jgi:hypothetical protein
VMTQWNTFEAVLFAGAVTAYFIHGFTQRYSFNLFYGYFILAGIGLYAGIILGEWLWHNSRLKHMDEIQRQRYWTNYKDNLLG